MSERHEWNSDSGLPESLSRDGLKYVLKSGNCEMEKWTGWHYIMAHEILRLAARVRQLEGDRDALAFVVAALPHSHDSTTGKCLVCGKKWHALFSEHSDGCPMPEAQSIAAREIESRIATREGS